MSGIGSLEAFVWILIGLHQECTYDGKGGDGRNRIIAWLLCMVDGEGHAKAERKNTHTYVDRYNSEGYKNDSLSMARETFGMKQKARVRIPTDS